MLASLARPSLAPFLRGASSYASALATSDICDSLDTDGGSLGRDTATLIKRTAPCNLLAFPSTLHRVPSGSVSFHSRGIFLPTEDSRWCFRSETLGLVERLPTVDGSFWAMDSRERIRSM